MKTKISINRLAPAFASVLLVAVFCSCGGAKLEQKVKVTSYCKGTTYVITDVWIYNWWGKPLTLEYSNQECVPNSKTDSVKVAEYNKALPLWERAKNCY